MKYLLKKTDLQCEVLCQSGEHQRHCKTVIRARASKVTINILSPRMKTSFTNIVVVFTEQHGVELRVHSEVLSVAHVIPAYKI